jgi:membrane-associated PAP2 superfamily phosphatase
MLFAHMLVPERVLGTQFGSEFGICMLMLLCPSAVPFALAGPGCFTACTLSGGYHAIVRASRDGRPLLQVLVWIIGTVWAVLLFQVHYDRNYVGKG